MQFAADKTFLVAPMAARATPFSKDTWHRNWPGQNRGWKPSRDRNALSYATSQANRSPKNPLPTFAFFNPPSRTFNHDIMHDR
jgi:hypothetical protein